ncbi:unnamed protein product [Camellia sinensis]
MTDVGQSKQGKASGSTLKPRLPLECNGDSNLGSKERKYGDIKPDNLLVTAAGTVKIGDFSVSQVFKETSLITPERLDGPNYVELSLNAQNKIYGRKGWGFVSGTKAAPKDVTSKEYEAWKDENCLVKSWLLDAMTKDIRSLFLRLAMTKEIWEAVQQTYSVDRDASKVLSTTLQGIFCPPKWRFCYFLFWQTTENMAGT